MSVAATCGSTDLPEMRVVSRRSAGRKVVVAEDITDGQLEFGMFDRRQTGRDLGQRCGRGQDRGAEEDARHADMSGDRVAAAFQDNTGDEGGYRRHREDDRRCDGAGAFRGGLLFGLLGTVSAGVFLSVGWLALIHARAESALPGAAAGFRRSKRSR